MAGAHDVLTFLRIANVVKAYFSCGPNRGITGAIPLL